MSKLNVYDEEKNRTLMRSVLENRCVSIYELADILARTHGTAQKRLQVLHDSGEVYIAEWRIRGEGRFRCYVPCYKLGNLPDAAKPDIKAVKPEPRKKVVVRRDPLIAALYGDGNG